MVGCSRKVAARGCVAPSSRGGRWLCRDALPTTSYPCRPASPDTQFRVRHDKRVLDPAEGRPIYGIGAGSHRPAQGANGRPCPRDGMRHAIRPARLLSTFSAQFFCSTRAADILPSRPGRIPGAARRPCQGWPAGPSVDDGLGLDEVEHGARLAISGGSQRRAHAAALLLSRAPCGTTPCSR